MIIVNGESLECNTLLCINDEEISVNGYIRTINYSNNPIIKNSSFLGGGSNLEQAVGNQPSGTIIFAKSMKKSFFSYLSDEKQKFNIKIISSSKSIELQQVSLNTSNDEHYSFIFCKLIKD